MKKIRLDVDTLRVASFPTSVETEWNGTVAAHEMSISLAPVSCTTKTRGCPITYGCPYTTP